MEPCGTMQGHAGPCGTMWTWGFADLRNHTKASGTIHCLHKHPDSDLWNKEEPCETMRNHAEPCGTIRTRGTIRDNFEPCAGAAAVRNQAEPNSAGPCGTMPNLFRKAHPTANRLSVDCAQCGASGPHCHTCICTSSPILVRT